MVNRLHFENAKEGENVSRYFAKRKCYTATTRNDCIFPEGIIVELDDYAFDAALDLADAFNMIYDVEY